MNRLIQPNFILFPQVEGRDGKGDEFSIIHNNVSDKRLKEQEDILNEGRKIIEERVHIIKQKLSLK